MDSKAVSECGFDLDPKSESVVPSNKTGTPYGFITPEISKLLGLEQERIEEIASEISGGAENIEDIYPLSALQEGMHFHHILNQRTETYVLSTLYTLTTREALEHLVSAIQRAIDNDPVLRTAIFWKGLEQPIQVVQRRATLPIHELSIQEDLDPLQALREQMRIPADRFNLQRAPLLRLLVGENATTRNLYALLEIHHLICDHQSLRTLTSLSLGYNHPHAYDPHRLPAYRNFVIESIKQSRSKDAEAFFRRKLGDVVEPTALFGMNNVHGDGSPIVESAMCIGGEPAERIYICADKLGVTPARIFHAAWALVVAHATGRDDIVFGAVVAVSRRRGEQSESAIGLFVNTLPLRLRLEGLTAKELIRQTDSELEELLEYGHTSLTLAQSCSGLAAGMPLFNSLLNYRHSRPFRRSAELNDAGIRVIDRGEGATNYPVTAIVDDSGCEFRIITQTDSHIDPARINGYLCCAVESLVGAVGFALQTPAVMLPILPPDERKLLLDTFNRDYSAYGEERLLHQLFEARVRLDPSAVAVVYEEHALTYFELNARANQLARHLRSKGVGPERLVGICLDRGLEMITCILGVLKAGGAYVPIDPTYPSELLTYILQDAAPMVMLTQGRLEERFAATEAVILLVDSNWTEVASNSPANLDSEEVGCSPSNLAYVIYTSGSTGRPKGVMIEHRNITRLFAATYRWFEFDENDVWTVFHSVSFDFSVWELWGALVHGGRAIVVPYMTARSPNEFYKLLCRRRVTVLNQTPGAFYQLIEAQAQTAHLSHSLRLVIFGGEALELWKLQTWWKSNHETATDIVNMYGITETTVHVTRHLVSAGDVQAERRSLIGRPISDLRIYILDKRGQLAPLGVAGEIYVSGAGVSRGYLNKPTLTTDRFSPDRFKVDETLRMYRTGDLARWLADGTLEYLGRNDQQVKLRGYRIELGEIEAALLRCVGVREAVVTLREDDTGDRRLVAYVVPKSGNGDQEVLNAEELRSEIIASLPSYMVPSSYVVLNSMPLTMNGKLDRKALPPPDFSAHPIRKFETTQGEIESALAKIWGDILGVRNIGRHDNFFELGGHSLLVVKMMEQLRAIGLKTEIRYVFESPTLERLAKEISKHQGEQWDVPPNLIPAGCEHITPSMLTLVKLDQPQIDRIVKTVPGGAANVQDIYPLTPLQEGMLFHHIFDIGDVDAYVLPTVLSLCNKSRLDQLVAALQYVVDRHPVLRTAVLWENLPTPVQVVYRQVLIPVETISLSVGDQSAQVDQLMSLRRRRMSLTQAPLIRVQVAKNPLTETWYALILMHHIVDDATSLKTMISEIVAHMGDRVGGIPSAGEYRLHVAQALALNDLTDSESFFRKRLSDVDEPTSPFGLLDVHGDGSAIEEHIEELTGELAQRIRKCARQKGVSAATLFHAAWSLVIAATSGRDDVVFGSVLLGRLQGSAGAKHIIGMFINTLPFRIRLADVTAMGLVDLTQQELVELISREQTSLAVAQRCSGVPAGVPLFTAVLNCRQTVSDLRTAWESAEGIKVLAFQERTNYPISMSVDDLGDVFRLTALSDNRIKPYRMTGYLSAAMRSLIDALEVEPSTPALALRVLPEKERIQVVDEFNSTAVFHDEKEFVHGLFEKQAKETPDATAVVYDGLAITYADINKRANQLARHVISKGVIPDQLVGICVDRCPNLVIGLLAILKAGGAYVPLDPTYPQNRLEFMLRDSSPKVMIAQSNLLIDRMQINSEVVLLDRDSEKISDNADTNLTLIQTNLHPSNLAYVIYTSGSSGRPKGVMIEHRNFTASTSARRSFYGSYDRFLLISSFAFDSSVAGIFGTLTTGGTLDIASMEVVRDPGMLLGEIARRKITDLLCVPSLYQSMLSACSGGSETMQFLRRVIVAGEVCPASLVEMSHKIAPRVELFNEYGPTEGTVWTTAYRCRVDSGSFNIPIGGPINNVQTYILNARREPAPLGALGEIYIGGGGVARGYLSRPELTAEVFVPDRLLKGGQQRLYRTGDYGRWRADGTIEFMGRSDQQIKLRGYRIELGEIEAQLLRHDGVSEAVVVAREDKSGDMRLLAYVVPSLKVPRTFAVDIDREQGDLVDEWRKLYEESYSAGNDEPSFVGWNSSYTGEPIPENEMSEWLSHVVSRIRELKPKRVLEIGCGVGLIVEKIAPSCERYVGSDISESVISKLRNWMEGKGTFANVELLHRPASLLEDLKSAEFDTIILNSVVQYFPSVDYLLAVLKQAIRLLRDDGSIFVGDVRNLRLLRTFHSAVQLSKAGATVELRQIKKRIMQALESEKELVLDPSFFLGLVGRFDDIAAVDVQLKRGRASNELTRYRYDVVLRKGSHIRSPKEFYYLPWDVAAKSSSELEMQLSRISNPAVRIGSVPNPRLADDAAMAELVASMEDGCHVAELRSQIGGLDLHGANPEWFLEFGRAYELDVKIRWSESSVSMFDVEIVDRSRIGEAIFAETDAEKTELRWNTLTNNPMSSTIKKNLVPELRGYLGELLPEHMIPTVWMMIDRLPLNSNGKVDRRALPDPELRPEDVGRYVAPETKLERRITDVWAKTLNLDQVGTEDNFFELGGHSLLAIRTLFEINRSFNCQLNVRDIYNNPTVRELARRIDSGDASIQYVNLAKEAALDEKIVSIRRQGRGPRHFALLTGATGFVGRFILAELLRKGSSLVYCMVRARSEEDALSRLKSVMLKWGLWRDEFEERIRPVVGNLSLPGFGMNTAAYDMLSHAVDTIYHCGASMNHLESYAMAKAANVHGVSELIRIAAHGKNKLINYISTLGVFGLTADDVGRVVEEVTPIEYERHLLSDGYLASKWIGEKLCMTAGERGIPVNIFRLGLVWADTEGGRYDELQRGDRIFRSCLLSGYGIEDFHYTLPPTPVDFTARAILYLASQHPDGRGIYHVSSSEQMTQGVFERCNEIGATSLRLLPLYDWVCELKRLHENGESLPAVPLFESTFLMNETEFKNHEQRNRNSLSKYNCIRTQSELEKAGVVPPIFNDELLRTYVDRVLADTSEAMHQRFHHAKRIRASLAD